MELFEIQPVFAEAVPIVLASDNKYINYLSVTLTSIVMNGNPSRNYDIIILENKVSVDNKYLLYSIVKDKKNFSLRFFNLTEYIQSYDFNIISYYSEAIYFRIFMPFVMTGYKKAVYLDCDLVTLKDIAELYDTDLKNLLVAGVPDIGVLQHYNQDLPGAFSRAYFEDNMPNVDITKYFNSGVLVMNLEEFRRDFTLKRLIKITNNKNFNFPDQDGLNVVCAGKTRTLPYEWNLLPQNTGMRTIPRLQASIDPERFAAYMQARSNPYIVHYAMREKPWLHTCELDFDLMYKFWEYAAFSPAFDKIYGMAKIPYIEKVELLNDLTQLNLAIALPRTRLNIHYKHLDIKNDFVTLEATVVLHPDDIPDFTASYFIDGKEYPCEILPGNNDATFGDRTIGTEICLRATFPVEDNIYPILTLAINGTDCVKNICYSHNFPIDKVFHSWYATLNGWIVTVVGNNLRFEKATRDKLKKYEKRLIKELRRQPNSRERLKVLIRKAARFYKRFQRKPIWLVGDNMLADDNGIAFFEYLQTQKKKIRSYFITDPNYDKNTVKKIKKIGKTVTVGTTKFKCLSLISDAYFDSVINRYKINPFGNNPAFRDIMVKRPFVFLQHGVITQDLSKEHNKFVYNPAGFVVSAYPEYSSLLEDKYHYTEKEVWLTGLPRFDKLTHDEKKIITVMPTWRTYLYPYFGTNTEFFKFYDALLHSEKLHCALKAHGYSLAFLLHPLLRVHIDEFYHGEDDGLFTVFYNYRQAYAESNLVVTDYSSAIFDFLYLNKPIIYAQFDREDFFAGHVYKQNGSYEETGFGEVEYDIDGVVNRIIEYVENGCVLKDKYKKRIDDFLAYRDANNCKRLFEKAYGTFKLNK